MSSIVQRRIGRLSPDAIKLARCAAVAGQDFSAELAAHVLGVRPLDLADAWAELEAAQVFRDGAFAHDLIYEAALASVPPPIARTLHAGIAEELTRRKGSPAAVAHHWIAAGDRGRAIAPLRQAAEQAIAAGRMSEAAEFFRLIAEACAALGDHDGQWRAMLERFECLFHVVGADELDELMQALLACARNDAQRAAAFQQRARLALTRIDLQGTREDALRAIELARNAGDPSLECEARLTLAQAMLRRRCPEEAAAALAAVQDWVQAEGSPSLRLLFAQCKAWLSIEMERFGQAWEQWVECARMSRELGDLPNVAVALSYQMLCLGYRGDFAGAATAGERARALLVEHALLGDPYPTIDSNLAHVYTWMGRYADALAAADRAEAVKADPGTLALRRGIVFLLLGQPARARPLIEQSASLAQAPMLRLPAQLWLARALRATGRDAATARRVEDLLSEAAAVAKQSTKTGPLARVHVVRAELAGDDTRLASAREAVELVRGTESFGLSIAAHIRLADALLASGHPRDAVAAVELALALAESFLPENMTIPDMLLTAHRVFSAVRDSRARAVAERAVNWIYTTAGTHVPPEFRDSFLHRNPVNRELLTLATRLR
jgi:tetratricopeptide (TPR) repeat protein